MRELERILTEKISLEFQADQQTRPNNIVMGLPGLGIIGTLQRATENTAKNLGQEFINLRAMDANQKLSSEESVLFMEVDAIILSDALTEKGTQMPRAPFSSALLSNLRLMSHFSQSVLVVDFKSATQEEKETVMNFLTDRIFKDVDLRDVFVYISETPEGVAKMPDAFKAAAEMVYFNEVANHQAPISSALAARRAVFEVPSKQDGLKAK